MTATPPPDKFIQWLNDSRPGDVVQIKTRFAWLKKVIVAVDEVWLYFHDAKIKKSSIKPETIKPVMQPQHPVVKEFLRLPKEQQIIMRKALNMAAMASLIGSGETIDQAFIRILKITGGNYKAVQVATNLIDSNQVEAALDMTIEARAQYKKDKAWLDGVEAEIERYFKPRGWICEDLNGSPFWVKSIHKEGIIRREFVLHGIEAKTNNYVYVKADFDKITDNQLGKEQTWHFSEFSKMITFIKGQSCQQ